MATLIGAGGHADDIFHAEGGWANLGRVAHHKFCTDDLYIIGINDPRLRYEVSVQLAGEERSWIHPDACLYFNCTYGVGTHINYGVTMTRTTVGHHCTISPGVTIAGDVSIGNLVFIGAGATICDRVTIDSGVTIGAGAVVLPETHIPTGETWVGVPARRPQ
jgi:UDP-3-O-[3-hydroxymyristoyl] glucosamine N-acyltransferase